MYLKKLDILGFKSFASKTEVSFNKGMTGIVGPNGCGKTNIVDAIRWCLGEQKSSTLRSDKMENVIFNGTAGRKPMGMAEVSLTIENDRGILPTEYSEVTISRRIFRSGESEYLLNKNICRLKDITNLFMDTGMGANAYSVIELKMVETILSNKAEERRNMFEEAAGVNKYKLRRRLTLKKLDDVKSDLTRVNDIVSEVDKKVNSLERQAKRADKYNKVSSTLRELEIDLAERELALFTKNKNEFKLKKEDSFQRKLVLESELSRLDDQLKEIKEELYKIEFELKEKRSEISSQTEKIHSVQQSLSVSEERRKSLTRNIERYKQELEELQTQLEISESEREESSERIEEIASKIVATQLEKDLLTEKVTAKKSSVDEQRTKVRDFAETLLVQFKEITSKENELSNINESLNRTNTSIAKLNEQIQHFTANIAKTVGFIEELSNERSDLQKKLTEAENLFTEKQKEKEENEARLTQLKEKELEEKGVINNLHDKISFLQSLIDNLEGFSKGAKALLEENTWSNSDKNLLANLGNTAELYQFAIEAALKSNLNNILVESLEEVKKGINYLQQHNFGKASFYVSSFFDKKENVFEKINSYLQRRNIKKIKSESGFIGWAIDLVETEAKWQPFFKQLLNDTIIVDTIDNAFRLAQKYKSYNCATLKGDFVHFSGVIEAGSEPRLDDTLFGRKQLLDNLKKEIPLKEKQLASTKIEIENLEEVITSIDLKVLSEKGRFLLNDLANVDKQISRFEFEKQKASDEIEKARKEIQELASHSNFIDNEREKLEHLLSERVEEKKKADNEQRLLDEAFQLLESEYSKLVEAQNKVNLEHERFLGERRNLENAVRRAEETIESVKRSIIKRENDIKSSDEELVTLVSIVDDKQFELDEFILVKDKLIKEEEGIDSKFRDIRSRINNLEAEQKKLRLERDVVGNDIHASEIKLNEIELKTATLKENISENYSLTLELKDFEDLESFDFHSRSEEVHSLKQQIRNLGPINLLAYSEYEEEKERLDFLMKQRTDLIDSERDLVKTIEEINNTAQTLFMDTFEQIRTHFVRIFRGLFNPGDEADLRLEENSDPLEAKIEIVAKPKGKRPTSIELLSGGEKTLTAIALLFAIYLVKPSPFCILDEIDAPLDDANIDRFAKILREFSTNTQFIIVTHNKRTMEATDTMYGVTMQEEGISKLVAVRFNEDFNIVA
ncbi:MAG: chromosome segregation protein SMC [Ignavibacteria bacterium]|nr:chromosome segregation protein SMC [Ignavibacteria bacterium]